MNLHHKPQWVMSNVGALPAELLRLGNGAVEAGLEPPPNTGLLPDPPGEGVEAGGAVSAGPVEGPDVGGRVAPGPA